MAREMPKQYKSEIPATTSRGFRFHVTARSGDFESLNHAVHEVRFSIFRIFEKADKHVITSVEIRGDGCMLSFGETSDATHVSLEHQHELSVGT